MHLDTEKKAYTLSARDLAVIRQAKVNFNELAELSVKHPGLPPLWSRMPYLMLMHHTQQTTGSFWREYRQLHDLLKNTDRHYRPAYIPKDSGGTRKLLVPDWELRPHQQFILKQILYRIPVSDAACAYCKNRGLADLARPHIAHEVLIHMDIKDFFSSISEQTVFEALLEQTGYPPAVAGFLSRLCCYRHYLPQGACTSPALSNICFKKCDDALCALAKKYGAVYTRYSDDIYLSGNGIDARQLVSEAKQIISRHGFRVNRDKTRILGRHQAQKVTAIVVNDKLQATREYRRKLRQELYYLQKHRENAKAAAAAEDYYSYLHQLLGRITFVLYVDPGNKEFLEARRTVSRMIDTYWYDHLPF